MIPWKQLGSADLPDGGQLTLWSRGGEYVIRAKNRVLMSSRMHHSEEMLAEFTCERLGDRKEACVLIGGLGMGFTLSAALQRLSTDATVVVAELVEAVIDWNRLFIGHLAGYPLADERVTVRADDVTCLLREQRSEYDAILLDIDNGPEGLSQKSNAWLYTAAGLRHVHRALRPRGVLAVWSASRDADFTNRLRRGNFYVEPHEVKSGLRKGSRHYLWIARRVE